MLVILMLLICCTQSTDLWEHEKYMKLKHLLQTEQLDKALEFAMNFPAEHDTKYWRSIPGIILTLFGEGRKEGEKVYQFADSLLSKTNGPNDDLIHSFVMTLIKLNCTDSAQALIVKIIQKKGGFEIGKALFNEASVQGTSADSLVSAFESILSNYPESVQKKSQDEIVLRWYFAKTLVKLRHFDGAMEQYRIVTHNQNFADSDDSWKPCIEFAKLLKQIPSELGIPRNGELERIYAWYGTAHDWYDEALRRIYHLKHSDSLHYFRDVFSWIRETNSNEEFMYLVRRMAAIYTFDDDVALLKEMYENPTQYFGRIERFYTGTKNGVIQMADGSGDREVHFIGNNIVNLRVGQNIKFVMQLAVGSCRSSDVFAVWDVSVLPKADKTSGSF